MDLKQTFSNLQAWAKKNPKTAGALALGVIVLAVIVARRAASSGGGGGGSASESAPAQIDGGQLDLSGLGTSGGSMPSVSGALDLGGGGGSAAGGGGEVFQPSAPALVSSEADFSGGGFSGDPGTFDATPAPSYASAAAPISTGDMLGLKTITATAGAGIKGAAAKVQPAKTTIPNNPGVNKIVATAGAGVGGSMYPPVLTSLKNTLSAGASKTPTPAPVKNLVASASAKIAPAKKTPTPAKKTTTPAPALFAWYKTPFAPRVWLPVSLAQARGYIMVA